MISKNREKAKAVSLRKAGKTYREILEEVPVAKSSLSVWLRDVGLSRPQVQRLTHKRYLAQLRGGAKRKEMRIEQSERIYAQSILEVGELTPREFFFIGVALYWAEGSKAKEYRPSVGIDFANSDPEMIKLFMEWLRKVLQVVDTDIMLTIHVHENHLRRLPVFEKFWLEVTKLLRSNLTKPIIKRHNPKTKRKNTGDSYVGLVVVSVKQSTNLNRRIQGWIYGIIKAQK